jgi:hypothetical protein
MKPGSMLSAYSSCAPPPATRDVANSVDSQ